MTVVLEQRLRPIRHQTEGWNQLKRRLCSIAIIVWVVTFALGGWLFVKGWTAKGSDGRTEILLAPVERDQILGEMRLLLKAVDGIVRGLGEPQPNVKQMEEIARSVGMKMAADTEPAIMAKLPLPFKQIGMSIHKARTGRTPRRTSSMRPSPYGGSFVMGT